MNQDFKELLQLFGQTGVRFLIVGDYALGAHGYPRATKGMDVFVGTNKDNAARLLRALNGFEVRLQNVKKVDFSSDDKTYRIGVAPQRVSIMTSIRGVAFEDAYQRRERVIVAGIELTVISLKDFIAHKLARGRPQDLVDADTLQREPPEGPI